jgi:hypothetical protein
MKSIEILEWWTNRSWISAFPSGNLFTCHNLSTWQRRVLRVFVVDWRLFLKGVELESSIEWNDDVAFMKGSWQFWRWKTCLEKVTGDIRCDVTMFRSFPRIQIGRDMSPPFHNPPSVLQCKRTPKWCTNGGNQCLEKHFGNHIWLVIAIHIISYYGNCPSVIINIH